VFASLRSRIVLILIAAVVPAAILVCVFAYRTFSDASATQIASLERDASFLLARLDVVPTGASRMARTIASIVGPNPEDVSCGQRVKAIIDSYEEYSAVGVVEGERTVCTYSKTDRLHFAELAARIPREAAALDRPVMRVLTLADGTFSLLALAPVQPARPGASLVLVVEGAYLGRLLSEFHSVPSSVAAVVERGFRPIVATPNAMSPDFWPAMPLPLGEGRSTLSRPSAAGRSMVYTVGKLAAVDLWLVTAQDEGEVLGLPRRQLLVTAIAPLVMILAAVAAIWIGLHGSVLRWVTALRNATRAYSAGAMTSRVGDASEAPREFEELAGSFDALADRMADRTIELEREIAAKSNYIREIHHRVKNNLQVIGSLLALQKRELPPDHRDVLRFPEDRVNAMSAAYRASYAVSEIGLVPIGNVVREVAHRLQSSGDTRLARFELEFSGAELEIDLDTAVSIAMLLAEILPAYADSGDRTGLPVNIRLAATPGDLVLAIRGHPSTKRHNFHLATRFIQAYLRQLGATMEEASPGETVVRAPFPAAGDRAR
jgi:two-component sensor histidine kinase